MSSDNTFEFRSIEEYLQPYGITFSNFTTSPLNTLGELKVPFKIIRRNSEIQPQEFFKKIAYTVFVACDTLTGFRASEILRASNGDANTLKSKVGNKRVEIFRDAVFIEILHRLSSNQFPEFSNLLSLVGSSTQVYGNARDFSKFYDYLNPQSREMLFASGWDNLDQLATSLIPDFWKVITPKEIEQLKNELKEYTNNKTTQAQETYATKEQLSEFLTLDQARKSYTKIRDFNNLKTEIQNTYATTQDLQNLEEQQTHSLSITQAQQTYESKQHASDTYATKSELATVRNAIPNPSELIRDVGVLKRDNDTHKEAIRALRTTAITTERVAEIYETKQHARDAFATKNQLSELDANKVSNNFANTTFATKTQLSNYLTNEQAQQTYESKQHASDTYATKSELQQIRENANSSSTPTQRVQEVEDWYFTPQNTFIKRPSKLLQMQFPVDGNQFASSARVYIEYQFANERWTVEQIPKLIYGYLADGWIRLGTITEMFSLGDGIEFWVELDRRYTSTTERAKLKNKKLQLILLFSLTKLR